MLVAVLSAFSMICWTGTFSTVGPCGLPPGASGPCASQNPQINVGTEDNGQREACVTFGCGTVVCVYVAANSREIVQACACGCCISFRPCTGNLWSTVDECSDMCVLAL